MRSLLSRTLIGCVLSSCSSLDKDNEPKDPPSVEARVVEQLAVYQPLVQAQLDSHGLVNMGGSIGDSALFSCLARVGGAAAFDPAILLPGGKPIRHPDIAPGVSKTPVSKDMLNGILWCIWDVGRKGDMTHARDLVESLVTFGKAHVETFGTDIGWLFCTNDDKAAYAISDEDWLGRCFAPPAVVKDIYRVLKWAGGTCDETCEWFMAVGPNLPIDGDGYKRHLGVLTTVRNGLVDGAINDNSLDQLRSAAEAQPRNALYLAAYGLYSSGDQAQAFAALTDGQLFPAGALPTSANYCSDYLFQRDEDESDWRPCGDGSEGSQGRGVEWIFAATMALGGLN